jgi:hypothetical protein
MIRAAGRTIPAFLLLSAVTVLLSVLLYGSASSDTHVLEVGALSSAFVIGDSSASYRMNWAAGEVGVSEGQSPSYRLSVGLWTGCSCDCHGNPVCDAAVCDVLDVVSAVTVAFRNGATISDPNADCPYETTDVDCSTFTDVIDVVKIVTVAFRNSNSATEFCTPCP